MNNNSLRERIEKMWSSQYTNGEAIPLWYKKYFLRFSPTRTDIAYNLINKFSGKLLDIGCGDADLLIKLSKYYSKLFGIDIVDYRIKRGVKNVEKKNVDNVRLSNKNIEDGLDFSNKYFDVVICLSVIEYTFDPYFTINEIGRVLKKDGVLVISMPNAAFIGERIKLLFGKLPNVAKAAGWQGGRLHNFTESSVVKLLENNGFNVEKVCGSGFLSKIRSLWPSLLCGDLIFLCTKK